jgi:hypothetical protein
MISVLYLVNNILFYFAEKASENLLFGVISWNSSLGEAAAR